MTPTLSILTWPKHAEALRAAAAPIDLKRERPTELAAQMVDACQKWKGKGLAAPQVGHLNRLIVIRSPVLPDDGPSSLWLWRSSYLVLANPAIRYHEGEHLSAEGCLSLPQVNMVAVRRAKMVAFETHIITPDGSVRFWRDVLRDDDAALLQHEIDHLDGILITDRIDARIRRRLAGKCVALPEVRVLPASISTPIGEVRS